MAGDWLKMTHALPEKPEVLAIAGKTGLNRYEVVGRLFILWRWFDNNTVDGNAGGVTSVTLNECLFGYGDVTGFVSAVVLAKWLTETDAAISVVKFDEHTSESAKQRAQTAKRVAKSKKKGAANGGDGNKVTTGALPAALPKEEKEKNSSSLRSEEKLGFDSFWGLWPVHDRKTARKQCAEKWEAKSCDAIAEQVIASLQAWIVSDAWTKNHGEFIPAPLVWLNQSRWEGAPPKRSVPIGSHAGFDAKDYHAGANADGSF